MANGRRPGTRAAGSRAAVDVLEKHVAETCRHFAGRVQSWDVVNEAILIASPRPDRLRPHVFLDKIGPDYLDIAYRAARAADPKALLVYNEFDIEMEKPDQLEKRRVMFDLIDGFKKRGMPLDAIGLQSHLFYEDMQHFDEKAFSRFLDELAARGLQIMLTELDCVDKARRPTLPHATAVAPDLRYLMWCFADRAVTSGSPKSQRPDELDRLGRRPAHQAAGWAAPAAVA